MANINKLTVTVKLTETQEYDKLLAILQMVLTDPFIDESVRNRYKNQLFELMGGNENE